MQDDVIIQKAHSEGFIHLPNFFSDDEISLYFSLAHNLPYRDRIRDFMSVEPMHSLLFHPKVLRLARLLIGSQDIWYYGETNFAINSTPYRFWHRDARGTFRNLDDVQEPSITKKVSINGWRFAIYDADYTKGSGGLKVSPGSHLRTSLDVAPPPHRLKVIAKDSKLVIPRCNFPIVDIQSRRNDLIVFNLGTFHSGGFRRFDLERSFHPEIENQLIEFGFPFYDEVYPRDALMFDYGGECENLDLYIKWRRNALITSKSPFQFKQLSSELFHTYYVERIRKIAAQNRICLRFDKCIAECAWAQMHFLGSSKYLSELLLLNREFTEFFCNREFVGQLPIRPSTL